ncbi:MAG TPA: sugar phosphate isomerase/epimerase family protein [Acidisarcina sp.]|nr:sugar phosphate isomerase/epimerase family protein [Acidisarcina sp.]
MADQKRISLNQITTERWTVEQTVAACVRYGIPSVALWRHRLAETGLEKAARLVQDAGLHVSSVCRGGMFPAPTITEWRKRIQDNLRAIEEAAELKADCLVLVTGADPRVKLADAREMVKDGIAAIASYAEKLGVCLGVEPLHPMFAGDRSVVNTIDQALDIAELYPASVAGVVLDVIHIWWDPRVFALIQRCAGRIVGFHVSDWLVPTPDILKCRGMIGDGVIDIRSLRLAVDAAGYNGPIEVEILNQKIWDTPGDEVVRTMRDRFEKLV